jgi:hypothetical protein
MTTTDSTTTPARAPGTVTALVRHIFRCPNCKRETVGPDPAKHHIVDGVMCGYCWGDIGPGDLVRTEPVPNVGGEA